MSDLTGLVHQNNPVAKQLAQWRKEVDDYLTMMQRFSTTDPGTVMEQISGMGARLIQIRCDVVRNESRLLNAFRTKELDPVLAQVEFQFKIHSRRLSSMTLDFDISRGAPS